MTEEVEARLTLLKDMVIRGEAGRRYCVEEVEGLGKLGVERGGGRRGYLKDFPLFILCDALFTPLSLWGGLQKGQNSFEPLMAFRSIRHGLSGFHPIRVQN